jgi:hypothetical protein
VTTEWGDPVAHRRAVGQIEQWPEHSRVTDYIFIVRPPDKASIERARLKGNGP